jgi:hypothetical protein
MCAHELVLAKTGTGSGSPPSGWPHAPYGAASAAGMIHPQASVRVHLCMAACDMRKRFDELRPPIRDSAQSGAGGAQAEIGECHQIAESGWIEMKHATTRKRHHA